jgi:hypothetical protein
MPHHYRRRRPMVAPVSETNFLLHISLESTASIESSELLFLYCTTGIISGSGQVRSGFKYNTKTSRSLLHTLGRTLSILFMSTTCMHARLAYTVAAASTATASTAQRYR